MDTVKSPKESIFKSSFRSFCNAFFAFLGVSFCFIIIGSLIAFYISSATGMTKSYFTIVSDADGLRSTLPINSPAILKISIDGIIGAGNLTTSDIESILLDSREGIFKNDRIKGILLCMDTPGGSVTDSNGIYEAIKLYKERYKIPVFAYVDGTCASGGMYITSAADEIHASSVSVVGSVGVILGPVFNFHDLLDNWGIKTKTISRGKDKEMLNPFTPWKPNEESSLYAITDYLYSHFVSIVAAARPTLDKEKLITEYGAQVYVAPTAQTLGYVDNGNATYSSTLKALITACGLKEDQKYQVIELSTSQSFVAELIENKSKLPSLTFLEKLTGTKQEVHELKDPFLYLYDPHRI